MKEYKAYIFDMDLTLLNTLVNAEKSYKASFKKMGLEFDVSTLTHHLSIPLSSTYDEMVNPTGTCEEYIESFRQEANATFIEDSFFYEDGIKLILELGKKNKLFGIVTNREYSNVTGMLDKEPIIKPMIKSIVTCDKVKNLKPDPEPILLCLKELGVSKEEAVYIGDAANDYKSAKAAGIDFICIERYNNCDFECETIIHDLKNINNE